MSSKSVLLLVITMATIVCRVQGSEDILSIIRKSHEGIGRCRIGCLDDLVSVSSDSFCQRQQFCKSCWDLCPKLVSDKSEEINFCVKNVENSCDFGCEVVCRQINQKVDANAVAPSVQLSTNLVGCTLYWKTSGLVDTTSIHQLYGMDSQETWFDLGQTTESFYILQPHVADRAVKLRLMVVTKESGTVAETEFSLGGLKCKPDQQTNINPPFLFMQNATQRIEQHSEDNTVSQTSTILIITSTLLLLVFILMTIIFVATRKVQFCPIREQFIGKQNNIDNTLTEEDQTDLHQNNNISRPVSVCTTIDNGAFYV